MNYIHRTYVLKEGDLPVLTAEGTKYVKYKQEDISVMRPVFVK